MDGHRTRYVERSLIEEFPNSVVILRGCDETVEDNWVVVPRTYRENAINVSVDMMAEC